MHSTGRWGFSRKNPFPKTGIGSDAMAIVIVAITKEVHDFNIKISSF